MSGGRHRVCPPACSSAVRAMKLRRKVAVFESLARPRLGMSEGDVALRNYRRRGSILVGLAGLSPSYKHGGSELSPPSHQSTKEK